MSGLSFRTLLYALMINLAVTSLVAVNAASAAPMDGKPGEVRVFIQCKPFNGTVFDGRCLDKIQAALRKSNPRVAERADVYASAVEKGYAEARNSKPGRRGSYDYDFRDPQNPATKVHIHFSWGEVVGILIAVALA